MPSLPIKSVISIGAIHQDTIAHAGTPIHPETSTPAHFNAKPGGVATNIARALNRLGVRTRLIGTVGADSVAKVLHQQLTQEGLDLSFIERDGYPTGQYIALHNPDGALAAACVDDRVLSEAPAQLFDAELNRLRQIAEPDTLWFLDANLPADMLRRVSQILTTDETAPRLIANAVSNAKAGHLAPVLPQLECLMLNRGEAAALTGLPGNAPIDEFASALTDKCLRRFVLTDGSAEVLLGEDGKVSRFLPSATEIVDVTGAGDALTAGILAALARGFSYKDALPFGLSAAALTLKETGALASDLCWDGLHAS